jgi:hypothetical protein
MCMCKTRHSEAEAERMEWRADSGPHQLEHRHFVFAALSCIRFVHVADARIVIILGILQSGAAIHFFPERDLLYIRLVRPPKAATQEWPSSRERSLSRAWRPPQLVCVLRRCLSLGRRSRCRRTPPSPPPGPVPLFRWSCRRRRRLSARPRPRAGFTRPSRRSRSASV